MDEKIDKIINLSGTKNKLQYINLFIAIFCWCNTFMPQISIAFLEKPPDVEYYKDFDPTKEKIITQFTYDMCKWDKNNYKIVNVYPYSLISETNIECDKIKIGLLGASCSIGSFLGAMIFNLMADNKGRKFSMIFGGILFLIFNTSITLFSNYYVILIFFNFIHFFAIFINYSIFLIAQEINHQDRRGLFGSLINVGFPLTGLIYFPLYHFIGKWRIIFIISSIITLINLIIFTIFCFESPRFYIMKGDFDKANEVLRNIAKFHGIEENYDKTIKSKEYVEIINEIKDYINNKNKPNEPPKSNNDKEANLNENKPKSNKRISFNVLTLFKYKSLRYKFLTMSFIGFCLSGSYSALCIFFKNLPGELFANLMINYSTEVFLGIILGFLINSKLGRKGTMIMFYILAIIGYCIYLLVKLNQWPKIIINIIIKLSIGTIFLTIYTYFLEIYPTPVRALGFGFNSAFDNIGGATFPLFQEYLDEDILFLVLAILAISDLILMLFMPETRGKPLPETIKELEGEIEKEENRTADECSETGSINKGIVIEFKKI